jgi:hypothetical protein
MDERVIYELGKHSPGNEMSTGIDADKGLRIPGTSYRSHPNIPVSRLEVCTTENDSGSIQLKEPQDELNEEWGKDSRKGNV